MFFWKNWGHQHFLSRLTDLYQKKKYGTPLSATFEIRQKLGQRSVKCAPFRDHVRCDKKNMLPRGPFFWYFVSKIVLTYCEKKLFQWLSKTFEIRGWRPRICKIFEITRTIYSNSERSEQFLVTECFFNLFLEVSHVS